MASLPGMKFHFDSKAGEPLRFTAAVTVSAQGVFSATIPPELVDTAKGVIKKGDFANKGAGYSFGKVNHKVYARTLDMCREIIGQAGNEYVACEVTTETVILYSYETKVAYFKRADGKIYPNGRGDTYDKVDGKWSGTLNGSLSYDRFYQIGVAAVVMDKIIHTRQSSVKVEYKRAKHKTAHHLDIPETWHDRLNSFIGLRPEIACAKEMPYTEEAAKFFYGMMMGMCKMADQISEFFADEGQVLLAIQRQTNFLAPPEKN